MSLCHGATEEMICAALLHDVLEDTAFTAAEMVQMMGPEITDMVQELTAMAEFRIPGENRVARKRYENHRLTFVRPEVQTIKVADLMDNTRSIVTEGPSDFAAIYLEEKRALLYDSLIHADPLLLHLAKLQLQNSLHQLKVNNDAG